MHRDPKPNLVSGLRAKPPRSSRLWSALWLAAVIAAALVAVMASARTLRGVALVTLLFLLIGGAIGWLTGRSALISSSGREMKDHVWPGGPVNP
jgi:hypothetical protein